MKISKIKLTAINLPFKRSFQTSYGVTTSKYFYLIEITDEITGVVGYGELEALQLPNYTEETADSAALIIEQFIAPLLLGEVISHPADFNHYVSWIRGNEMAKAAIEMALWDLYAKLSHCSLKQLLGGSKEKVFVGVSLGIETDLLKLKETVQAFVYQGYTRVKLKIKPGHDIAQVKAIREKFPDLDLMVDANSSYQEKDIAELTRLDDYNLAMIEQPFAQNDLVQHRLLQQQIKTPVCLDENIRSLSDTVQAVGLGSCLAINLKPARVGGLAESLKIIQFCQKNGILVWCGGMYEAGIGRAHNLALASRLELTFPGDISATSRYFAEDIVTKEFKIEDGKITVPNDIGIGIELSQEAIRKYKKQEKVIKLK